jgi:hypothetical protein
VVPKQKKVHFCPKPSDELSVKNLIQIIGALENKSSRKAYQIKPSKQPLPTKVNEPKSSKISPTERD